MIEYTKQALTIEEQIDLLRERGLIVENDEYAQNILKRISYYRLSAYFLPFQEKKDLFNKNTSIEEIKKLYVFDHNLRTIVFSALKIIEVAIRSAITYAFSHKYGVFGYLDKDSFSKYFKSYDFWFSSVKKEVNRSKELFVEHYKSKYCNPSNLPIWMVTEVISFGSLSKMYKGMKKEEQEKISSIYSVQPVVFESWLHTFVYIRNICAHHSRLWNRVLSIKPKIPRKGLWNIPEKIDNKKVFSVLSALNYCLRTIQSEISPNFKNDIEKLFHEYSEVDVKKMGFLENWKNHKIWE